MIAQTYQTKPTERPSLSIQRNKETEFPSSATDHLEDRLNLHDHIVQRPTSTFFSRINGNENRRLGVNDGDLLVIDRSLAYRHNSLVVVELDGDLQLCRLWNSRKQWSLERGDGSMIQLNDDFRSDTAIWGVISHVIHSCL